MPDTGGRASGGAAAGGGVWMRAAGAVLLCVVMGAAAVAALRAMGGQPRLEAPERVDVGLVHAFESFVHTVPVRNTHPRRSAKVTEVVSSCWCAVPIETELSIPANATVELPVLVRPLRDSGMIFSRFEVRGARGEPVRFRVVGEVLRVFKGWPYSAEAERDGDEWVIRFAPEYEADIWAVAYEDPAADETTPVEVDYHGRRIVLEERMVSERGSAAYEETPLLIVTFGVDGEEWEWRGRVLRARE